MATSAEDEEPLGIALEGWPYPAAVSFLPVPSRERAVRMAYMDLVPDGGERSGTVVLLHGKNFDSSYWSGVAEALVRAGRRVVIPDQIGFNKSAKPALDYSFDLLAGNTLALLDHLGIGSFDVVGHSTGGGLAIVLAGEAGDRVHRLVLEDPIGIVTYRDFIPEPSIDDLLAAERAYTTESYRAFIAHFFHDVPADRYERFVTWRMRVTRSAEFERFALASALTYRMIHRQPLRSRLEALSLPILLTAGSEDRSTPMIAFAPVEEQAAIPTIPEVAEELAVLTNIDLRPYPGVGHIPHLDAPDRFERELVRFLDTGAP